MPRLNLANVDTVGKQRGTVLIDDLVRLAQRRVDSILLRGEEIGANVVSHENAAIDRFLNRASQSKLGAFPHRRRLDQTVRIGFRLGRTGSYTFFLRTA